MLLLNTSPLWGGEIFNRDTQALSGVHLKFFTVSTSAEMFSSFASGGTP